MTIAIASRKVEENKTTCPKGIFTKEDFLVMGKVVDRFLVIRPSVNGVSLLFPHRHPFMENKKVVISKFSGHPGRPSTFPSLETVTVKDELRLLREV